MIFYLFIFNIISYDFLAFVSLLMIIRVFLINFSCVIFSWLLLKIFDQH